MALPEIKQETLLQTSLSIRNQIVADWKKRVQKDSTINPLRAMSLLYYDIVEAFRENKINPDEYPTNFTIGSLNPRRFAITRNEQPDPLEKEFSDLASQMTIGPNTDQYKRIIKGTRQQIEETAWTDSNNPVYTSYDPWARGTEETRTAYLEGLKTIGIKDIDIDQTFFCAGGMDGIVRSARALSKLCRFKRGPENIIETIKSALPNMEEKQIQTLVVALMGSYKISHQIQMGFPIPGFMMAANASANESLDLVKIPTSEENNFFPSPEEITETIKQNKNMEILMLTPLNNPTTIAWEPTKLKKVLEAALQEKPDIKFIFDMAYINTVNPKVARGIIEAIYESGTANNTVMIFSRSKEWAQPRLRSGLILAIGPEISNALNMDTLSCVPSQPYDVDFHDRALETYYKNNPQVLKKYQRLLRQRQSILLQSLKGICQRESDSGKESIFDLNYLNRIVISTKDNQSVKEDSIVVEVPLYIYVKLKDGMSAWDLAEKYGIIAVPGDVFGGEHNMVRFSIGTLSSSDITSIAN